MEVVSLNQISPDQVIIWSWGFITLNVTILYTWLVMAILVVGSWLVTRNLSSEMNVSRWQHFLEVVISIIRNEIREMTKKGADNYIPFDRNSFSFHLRIQCSGNCSGVRRADFLHYYDSGAGHLRFYRRSLLRHITQWRWPLSERIFSTHFHLFPVPCHGGTLQDARSDSPSFRQHYES
jgi:hypothetical protein